MSLSPCDGCGRHVRHTESRCPFCGNGLATVAPPSAPMVPSGLGRAAILAFGALATTAACSGNVAPAYGTPPPDAGPESVDAWMGGGDAAYGGPPLDAAVVEDAPISPSDTGGGGNLYGGPPADSGNADDAGGPVPLYGGAGF